MLKCYIHQIWMFLVSSVTIGEGNGTLLQYSCLENPMDGGTWWAAVHGVTKSRTRLSDFTFTFHFHALEKEMATHSSVLAWRIPGMGDPGGLSSLGLHRVGHDWSDLADPSRKKKTIFLNEVFISFSLQIQCVCVCVCVCVTGHGQLPLFFIIIQLFQISFILHLNAFKYLLFMFFVLSLISLLKLQACGNRILYE